MKKYLLKIVFFILPLSFVSVILDPLISNRLSKCMSFSEYEYPVWNDLRDGKLNSEVLVYGSSRAKTHFNTKIMEEELHATCYNLGINGHTFNTQFLRHRLAMDRSKRPALILLSLDVSTFQKVDLYNIDQFLPYLIQDELFYNYLKNQTGFNYFDYHLPFVRYYGRTNAIKHAFFDRFQTQKEKGLFYKGFLQKNVTWNSDYSKAQKQKGQLIVVMDNQLLSLFDAFVSECKSKGIKVVLVVSPIYIEGQAFIQNYSKIIDSYRRMANERELPFIDYSSDSISFDRENFYNASHLNGTGSTKFTNKLCDSLMKLMVPISGDTFK